LYLVWQAGKAVDIPVIGIGGITSAEDAIEFFIAGASAVQIGTWNFIQPGGLESIIDGIRVYMEESGIPKLSELIGTLTDEP
jgi:dihydroorotate dehydrogenase (NAD+) catalytic subunit